jgi:hypothetical protein
MKEIKIICDSEIIIKNIKTGHIYKDEAEVQADSNAKPEDIKRDVKIIVPTIPLFSKT